MIFSLGMADAANRDFDEILANADADEQKRLKRARKDLLNEMRVDGLFKGAVAPFNPNIRAFEDEQKLLRVIYDVTRSTMDRYILVLHFVRVVSSD